MQTDIEDIITSTPYFQDHLNKLLKILQPSYCCLDLVIKVLLHGPDGAGKRMLAKTAARNLNMAFLEERVADLFDENIVGTEKKVRAAISKCATSAPCVMYLAGLELLTKLENIDMTRIEYCLREVIENLQDEGMTQPMILIAATNDYDQVYKTVFSDMFQYEIPIHSPDLPQAVEILKSVSSAINMDLVAEKLLGTCNNGEYFIGNILALVSKSLLKKPESEDNSQSQDEAIRWMDVGGLNEVKQEIVDAIQLSLDFPQLKKTGLRRTGILLHGPPGTGKTLLAKAIATECSLNFINVKGPELLNEYVGQSEDNIRKLFQRARESSPSVIFFDEIDSLAPNRGQAGDSGGVMDRMVSQILAEMDGVGKSEGIFVIGATNRVDLVDPSLLRPGRFDKVLEVPLPETKESRIQILKALTRKMNISKDVDLEEIESSLPSKMSGADFQGLCSKAMQLTFDRCVDLVESGKASEDEVDVSTTMNDFKETINQL